jgi:hypothetical protein
LVSLKTQGVLEKVPENIRLDHSKDKTQGDFASNIAIDTKPLWIHSGLVLSGKTLLLTILSFITSKLLFSCSGLKQFNPTGRAIKSAHCKPVELLCLLAIIISTLVFMPLKLPLEHILLNSSSKSL